MGKRGFSITYVTSNVCYDQALVNQFNLLRKIMDYNFTQELRTALSSGKDAKDASRTAGTGIWANYVRATCYPNTPTNIEVLSDHHKNLVTELNNIQPLTKDEKNSLRSAKCVVAKAITKNMDVWLRDELGFIVVDTDPMPVAKSELSESKSDYDRMLGFIEQANAKYSSDTRDEFTAEELSTLANLYSTLAHSMITHGQDL